jgi:ATP-dependent DNA helicase RecQ
MAYYFPKQLSSLSEISGVGQQKLNEFGQSFLAVIVQYALEHNLSEKEIPKKEKKNDSFGSSMDFTKQLLTQKVSVDEICKQRSLKLSTVVEHIEKIVQMDSALDISYLYPDKKRLLVIKNAFEETGGWLLTPVKEILGEDFSFDEIKIARIVIRGGK